MAVQFSLSYDANGDPVLVENTVSGTRKVVSRSSVVSPYKSRFETPATGDPITDAEESQPESNQSAIMDYIMEMEKGAANDPNLSFVQKQNLERYTPEAIEARGKKKTRSQEIVETVIKAVLPYANAAGAAVKALEAILPEESEEIKAIKQFYADPEQQALVESIPGMSDYNLVYGNPFDPSYGLANAAQKRIDTINKTLARQAKKGKQSQVLLDRRDKLQELKDKEDRERNRINRTTTAPVGAQFKETGYADPGADAEENQPYSPPSNNDGNNQGGGSFDTSAADRAGTSEGSGQFSPKTSGGRSGY